jgi:hypothetical protein
MFTVCGMATMNRLYGEKMSNAITSMLTRLVLGCAARKTWNLISTFVPRILLHGATCAMIVLAGRPSAYADQPRTFSVEVSAIDFPAQRRLSWNPDPVAQNNGQSPSYTIRRRTPITDWVQIGTVAANTFQHYFDDTDPTNGASANQIYEYEVIKVYNGTTGYGYVRAGAGVDVLKTGMESRGKVLVIVENGVAGALATSLDTLKKDLLGDGWKVEIVTQYPAATSETTLRQRIIDEKTEDSSLRSVLLIGAIKVVMAGTTSIDGHPEEVGPRPADGFYGDVDGAWGSPNGNGVYLSGAEQYPSTVELAVGRIDFSNMQDYYDAGPPPYSVPGVPTLRSMTETQLLIDYLSRNHAYRVADARPAANVALIGDRFGDGGGQHFVANAYSSFAALVGKESNNLTIADSAWHEPIDNSNRWITKLSQNSYMFAWGSGTGFGYPDWGYDGLGTDGFGGAFHYGQFYSQNAKAAFYQLFGSHNMDWNERNCTIRAALGTTQYGLAAMWAGRPFIYIHGMGLGETIGACFLEGQNNNGRYHTPVSSHYRQFHIGLMGDPTLRAHYLKPPPVVSASASGSDVNVTWTLSPDSPTNYYVYRASNADGPFTRIATVSGSTASHPDQGLSDGTYYYMVRALKQQSTGSGTYDNLSTGGLSGGVTISGNTVAMPSFSPGPNTYTDFVDVTLATTTSGASIRYTTNGTTPSDSVGNPYTPGTPVHITSTSTLKAIAYKSGMNNSAVNSGLYTITAPSLPIVNVTAPDNSATVGSTSDMAQWRFARVDTNGNPVTAGNLVVNFTLGGTAVSNTDYRRDPEGDMPVTVTIPNGSSSVTWTIRAFANSTSANPHNATCNLSTNSNYTVGSSGAQINFQAAPPPGQPTITIEALDSQARIGTTDYGVFRFTRTGSTSAPLTIQYVYGPNAITWDDFRKLDDTMPDLITFPAGSATVDLTIKAVNNVGNQNPHFATFIINVNANYTVGTPSSAVINILPPQSGTPVITAVATDPTAAIGTSDYGTIRFSRTGDTSSPLTIQYLYDGTASTWNDFRKLDDTMPDTIMFPANAATVDLTLKAVANINNVSPWTIVLRVSPNSQAYSPGTPASATISLAQGKPSVSVTATDTDTTIGTSDYARVVFTRTGSTSSPLTIQYFFDGNASTWNDFRRLDDTMPDTIEIPANSSTVEMIIKGTGNQNNVNPEFATFTIKPLEAYDIVSPSAATIYIH